MSRTKRHGRATDKQPLTRERIAALEPRDREYAAYDSKLPDFHVRVHPSGRKVYRLGYRLPSGRYRYAALGRCDIVTLDQARRRAKEMIGLVIGGKDPLSVRDAAKGALTVADVVEQYEGEHVNVHLKPKTAASYRQHFRLYILPALGTIPIQELTSADAAKLQFRLRSTPVTANRVIATLSSLLSWCEQRHYRDQGTNSCRLIKGFSEDARQRYLTPAELKRLGACAAGGRTVQTPLSVDGGDH